MAKDSNDSRSVAKGLAKLLIGGAAVAGGARIGAPAMRGLVRVSENASKGKFLNSRLGRLLKPFTRTALYGDDIARQARSKGVVHMIPSRVMNDQAFKVNTITDTLFPSYELNKKMHKLRIDERLFNKMMSMERPSDRGSLSKEVADAISKQNRDAVKFYGFVPRPKGSSKGIGSVASESSRAFADNKVNQYKLLEELGLQKYMPKNIDIADVESALNEAVAADPKLLKSIKRKQGVGTGQLAEALKRKLGKDVFIKKIEDTAGATKSIQTLIDATVDPSGRVTLRPKDVKNYMFQEAAKSEEFKGIRKWLQGTKPYKAMDQNLTEMYGKDHPRHYEYRVHAVNGKVVPFATSEKWDPMQYFNPFETARKRKIEKAFQEILDAAAEGKGPYAKKFDVKNHVFGADVGIGADGNPIFYELNPTMTPSEHFGSGQLNFPWIQGAVSDAIKGKMPLAQKIQLALGGGTVGTGAMVAGSGAGNLRGKSKKRLF